MAVDVQWTTLNYGSDLAWYAGATPVAVTNADSDFAICRYRRQGDVMTFLVTALFGAGLVAAVTAAGAGAWFFELPPKNSTFDVPLPIAGTVFDATAGYITDMFYFAASDDTHTPEHWAYAQNSSTTGISKTLPMTWAVGDQLFLAGSIEGFGN